MCQDIIDLREYDRNDVFGIIREYLDIAGWSVFSARKGHKKKIRGLYFKASKQKNTKLHGSGPADNTEVIKSPSVVFSEDTSAQEEGDVNWTVGADRPEGCQGHAGETELVDITEEPRQGKEPSLKDSERHEESVEPPVPAGSTKTAGTGPDSTNWSVGLASERGQVEPTGEPRPRREPRLKFSERHPKSAGPLVRDESTRTAGIGPADHSGERGPSACTGSHGRTGTHEPADELGPTRSPCPSLWKRLADIVEQPGSIELLEPSGEAEQSSIFHRDPDVSTDAQWKRETLDLSGQTYFSGPLDEVAQRIEAGTLPNPDHTEKISFEELLKQGATIIPIIYSQGYAAERDKKRTVPDCEDFLTDMSSNPERYCDTVFYTSGINGKAWTIANIISDMKIWRLTIVHQGTFTAFLNKVFPPRDWSSEKRQIYSTCAAGGSLQQEKLKSFMCKLFPPVITSKNYGPFTYGDNVPQFVLISGRKSNTFKCTMCPIFEPLCGKVGKSSTKLFQGITQMYQHGVSKLHKRAIAFVLSRTKHNASETEQTNQNESASDERTTQRKLTDLNFTHSKIRDEKVKPVPCCGIFDENIVTKFCDDQYLHRKSPKTAYNEHKELHCLEHVTCADYKGWSKRHNERHKLLLEYCVPQAELVNIKTTLNINGRKIVVRGAIKSIVPPCELTTVSYGHHPYTCHNCFSHVSHFNNVLLKRLRSALPADGSRDGKQGMRRDFLKKSELQRRVEALDQEVVELKRSNVSLRRIVRSASHYCESLSESMNGGNDAKFVMECLDLFRQPSSPENCVQIEVVKNLLGKLKSGHNHKYTDTIKRIAKMHANVLGPHFYSIFKDILCFPSGSTVQMYTNQGFKSAGLQDATIAAAAERYEDDLVVECSDQARLRRTIEARLSEDGKLELIGPAWSANCRTWPNTFYLPEPLNGEDDFIALDNWAKEVMEGNKLSTHASIHNFSAMSGRTAPCIFLVWPTPNSNYTSRDLSAVQQMIRQKCASATPPVKLIGHSADSASVSLSLAVHTMTPNDTLIQQGIRYLGLGIKEERFVAPFFWTYPTIHFLDHEHNQRSCMRQLRYATRDLTMYKSENICYTVTMDHLQQLRTLCTQRGVAISLSDKDLVAVKFFDQDSEAACKIFNPQIADLLDKYLPGVSLGTSLYITMVSAIMSPYRHWCTNPLFVAKEIGKGLQMLRLWRRYVELTLLRLNCQRGAVADSRKRGHFITKQTYDSLEVQCHASLDYLLCLYLFCDELSWPSPRNASTISTEHFIGQLQSKTVHFQSLNQEASLAELLDRARKIDFNVETLHLLGQVMDIKPSSSRKRSLFKFSQTVVDGEKYMKPPTYAEFKAQLASAVREGFHLGQKEMSRLPVDFKMTLLSTGCWEVPYEFRVHQWVVEEPPTYDKLHVSCALNECESESNMDEECLNWGEEVGEPPNDAETDEPSPPPSDSNQSLYINRGDSQIHIYRALKLIVGGRDWVSKERHKRHIATRFPRNLVKIPANHDIILYRDYFFRFRGNVRVFHLTSIRNDKGEVLQSSYKVSDNKARGTFYQHNVGGELAIPTHTELTPWIACRNILGEALVLSESGRIQLAPESLLELNQMESPAPTSVCDTDLSENEFVVEKVIEARLNNKSHEQEFLTKFFGYGSDECEWIPASNFRDPVEFNTVSKQGRQRTVVAGKRSTSTRRRHSKRTFEENDATTPSQIKRLKRMRRSVPAIASSSEDECAVVEITVPATVSSSKDATTHSPIKCLKRMRRSVPAIASSSEDECAAVEITVPATVSSSKDATTHSPIKCLKRMRRSVPAIASSSKDECPVVEITAPATVSSSKDSTTHSPIKCLKRMRPSVPAIAFSSEEECHVVEITKTDNRIRKGSVPTTVSSSKDEFLVVETRKAGRIRVTVECNSEPCSKKARCEFAEPNAIIRAATSFFPSVCSQDSNHDLFRPGILNCGNSCWLNSTLQAFSFLTSLEMTSIDHSTAAVREFLNFAQLLKQSGSSVLDAEHVLNVVCKELTMNKSRQQDVYELIMHILNQGRYSSLLMNWKTSMLNCSHDSVVEEETPLLLLPINTAERKYTASDISVRKLLDLVQETSEEIKCVRCVRTDCNKRGPARRNLSLVKANDLLVLWLKRFHGRSKVSTRVHISRTVDIAGCIYEIKTIQM